MTPIASLEAHLQHSLYGQEEAIREFASAIDRSEKGPPRPGRTRAFLLLLGPTGTGKTEMVKQTARYLYGATHAQRLERFDMGEYQHPDSVLRLLGAKGQTALLGAAIDRLAEKGGGILLFDEIEKAHPDLLTLLLSFDDARTTMSDGSTRDLSSCYVMLTSNLGAAEASLMVTSGYSAIRRKVLREAELRFRKETVARFSSCIVMNALGFEVQERIARQLLRKELRLQSEHLRRYLEIEGDNVVTFLVGKGFSPDLGARHIRKTIERYVGDALRDLPPPDSAGGPGGIGDRWTDGLSLAVEGDGLAARPLPRSAPLSECLRTQELQLSAL